jgi:hypothetical protein
MVRGVTFLEGAATTLRPDVSSESMSGFGFLLQNKGRAIAPFGSTDVSAWVTSNGVTTALTLSKPAQLALDITMLNPSASRSLIKNLDDDSRQRFLALLAADEKAETTGHNKRDPLCVVTYAQDAGAWFPYFYRYYSTIIGPQALYVITPKPTQFIGYQLGGLISAANLQFDNIARAYLQSALATGLHAYYEWSLVCDVDEFIMPYPGSGQGFLEALAASKEDILLSRLRYSAEQRGCSLRCGLADFSAAALRGPEHCNMQTPFIASSHPI